ncbi:MAG TPA: hypothetical protein VGK32_22905 [Vicinamibacterales bacterium]|jgi:hypothetical protein
MSDQQIVRDCRAALQASIEGSLGLLKLSRQLLERMESADPLPAEIIGEYRSHFNATEEQLRMLQTVLDRWAFLAATPTQIQ